MGEIERYRPANFAERLQYAKLLAEASLVPAQYRGKPANILLIMDYGDSLDLPYSQAISLINIIDGKPSASAALISARVRLAGHRLRVSCDEEALVATATIVRDDDPDWVFTSVWDIAKAARASLCTVSEDGTPHAKSKDGNPLAWEKYPAALLKARAITEVAREACQEALMGVQYTPEELGAVINEDGTPVDDHDVRQRASDADRRPPVKVTSEQTAVPDETVTVDPGPVQEGAGSSSRKQRKVKGSDSAESGELTQWEIKKAADAAADEAARAALPVDEEPPPESDTEGAPEDDTDWGNYWVMRLAEAESSLNMEDIQALAKEAKDHGEVALTAEAQEAWRRAVQARKT